MSFWVVPPPKKNLLLKINLIGCPTNRKSHLCKETCLLILKKRNRNKAEKKKRPSFYMSSVSPRVTENGTSYHGLISFGSNVVLRMAWSEWCRRGWLSPKNYSEPLARELGSGSRLPNFLTALPVSLSSSGKTTTNCLTEKVSNGSLRWGRTERKIQSTTRRLRTGQRGALDSVTHRFNLPAGLDSPAANLLPFCFAQMLEGRIYS